MSKPPNEMVRWALEFYPVCALHGTRIVDSLPAGCLGGAPGMTVTQAEAVLQDRAWQRLGDRHGDQHAALADLARVKICGSCQVLRHPHVRYLRGDTK